MEAAASHDPACHSKATHIEELFGSHSAHWWLKPGAMGLILK